LSQPQSKLLKALHRSVLKADMSILVDTNVILFGLLQPKRISATVQKILNDKRLPIFASVASVYEIGLKVKLGKLNLTEGFDVALHLKESDVKLVEISSEHALIASQLPLVNRDPWDRLIVAQCFVNGHQLASSDEHITKLGIGRIW
jgi:PIN domain nuclease of toxin-antitoxin system